MIFESLTVGLISTNCYIVGSETTRNGIVIDPGGSSNNIMRKIEDNKLKISLIVVTHSHFDHLGAVKAIKNATGAKFAAGTGSEKMNPSAYVKMVNILAGGSVTVPEPDILLADGDNIDVDDLHFDVLYTPGHSADEICLYGHGMLFSGDTLFNNSIGRTDFPGCSFKQLEDSIRSKLYTLPEDTIVFPGHGPETTIGDEKRGNPFVR